LRADGECDVEPRELPRSLGMPPSSLTGRMWPDGEASSRLAISIELADLEGSGCGGPMAAPSRKADDGAAGSALGEEVMGPTLTPADSIERRRPRRGVA
jgi:hypothetical protein